MSGYERLPLDAYFTIDQRPVLSLFSAMPEFSSVITGILEPFCGAGHMAQDLKAQGQAVFSYDIKDYGYRDQMGCEDFFDRINLPVGTNSIISNSPYQTAIANRVIEHALDILPTGGILALLFNHKFDAAVTRQYFLTPGSGFFCKVVLPYRIKWIHPCADKVEKHPQENHAWYVWAKGWQNAAVNRFADPAATAHLNKRPTRPIDLYCQQHQPMEAAE